MFSRFTTLRTLPKVPGLLQNNSIGPLKLAFAYSSVSPASTLASESESTATTTTTTTNNTDIPKTVVATPILSSENLLKRSFKYTKPSDITPLKEASSLYATIHLYDRKFLVTEGDKVSIPVAFNQLKVGDVLNFDQVSIIGSRDYTLTGNPRIDSKVFSIKGVVLEKTRVRRSVFSKSKRRRRHVRHVVKKNALTVLRISELKVNEDY